MGLKKAERLEKHNREIRRKAYLNLFLTLVAVFGIGIMLWRPLAEIIAPLVGGFTAIVTGLVIIGSGILIYSTPLLHFKEEYKVKSNKSPEHYLEKGLDNSPMVQMMESQGWEEVNITEDKITLEKYVSILHREIGRKSTMEIEILERNEKQEISKTRVNGKEVEKVILKIEPEGEGSIMQETGVSLKRYSPAFLELFLFMIPKTQNKIKEAADENLEILDENIEYGFSKFSLEDE